MKPQQQLAGFVFIILLAWVDGADVPSCASMKSWFPGTNPQTFADNLPFELSVTGYVPDGESIPRYIPESSHTGKMENVWVHSSVGRASHRYRGGHGFESC